MVDQFAQCVKLIFVTSQELEDISSQNTWESL